MIDETLQNRQQNLSSFPQDKRNTEYKHKKKSFKQILTYTMLLLSVDVFPNLFKTDQLLLLDLGLD